ncbi:hypothetical protein EON65_27620 [archaeon]|nr:MAG: hypothetical protein EON65_27620 [archaeon]
MGNTSHKLLTSHGPSAGADMPLWLLFVLEYCDWDIRLGLILLSKQWKTNAQTASFHRFLCDRLARERGIYVPFSLPPRYSWKTLFQHLFSLRNLWQSGETNQLLTVINSEESTKIQVYAKFRPLAAETEDNDENAMAGVTLPLHQRLAIIKMNRKISNNREALKVLTQEGGWFQAKWQSLENMPQKLTEEKGKGEGIKKSTAVFYTDMKTQGLPRHMQESASKAGSNKIVSRVISHDALFGRVVMMTPDTGLREFNFNSVLPPATSQKVSYDTCVKPLVIDMLNGYNATAVVYGQTGSGKTYTMFGNEGVMGGGSRGEDRGIIPRACEEILAAMRQREGDGIDAVLKVSYVEIFGDQVS